MLHWIPKPIIDSIHILFWLYLLLWFGFSTSKLAGFHQNIQGINQGHLSISFSFCPGGGKMGRPIAQANIQLELPEFDPKYLSECTEEFAEFLLLTGQSHVDVATKCSLLKRSCKKKFLQKQVKQIVKTCSTWLEVLQRLEKTFPVYETDLSVRAQIEELPMLPEVSFRCANL